MKLLVFSDSHGEWENMVEIARREEPDMIVHLGDCWRDAEKVMERFPDTPFYRVPGNCDFRLRDRTEQILWIEGKRILLCHGHTYGVKQGLWEAEQAAKEQKLDAFLFGHTHRPLVEMRGGVLFFNPGSVGLGAPCTYGILEIDGEGRMNARTALAYPDTEVIAVGLGGHTVSRR